MNLRNHLQGLLGDLRFAARSLRRSPGFAATTIVSLALGVALTASTLSVTNSYVVRAMPFPELRAPLPCALRLSRSARASRRGARGLEIPSATWSKSPITRVWAASSCTPTITRRKSRRWNAPPARSKPLASGPRWAACFRPTISARAASASS